MRNLRLLVLLSFIGAPLHAASAQSYHLTDLGILDGYSASFGYGVSDSGGYVSGWLERLRRDARIPLVEQQRHRRCFRSARE